MWINGAKHAAVSAMLLTAFISPGACLSQESDATAQCNRAWLASDWPTVAIQCSETAFESETKYRTLLSESTIGTAEMQAQGENLAAAEMFFAGAARTRATVAYAKLSRPQLSAQMKQQALDDLSKASPMLQNSTPVLYERAETIRKLILSPTFLHDAPDDQSLADI